MQTTSPSTCLQRATRHHNDECLPWREHSTHAHAHARSTYSHSPTHCNACVLRGPCVLLASSFLIAPVALRCAPLLCCAAPAPPRRVLDKGSSEEVAAAARVAMLACVTIHDDSEEISKQVVAVPFLPRLPSLFCPACSSFIFLLLPPCVAHCSVQAGAACVGAYLAT